MRANDIQRDWPLLMDLAAASAFLALSPGSLLNLLRREHVAPVDLGGRIRRWRRHDLEDLITRLPVRADPMADGLSDDSNKVLDNALAAVERRTAARSGLRR